MIHLDGSVIDIMLAKRWMPKGTPAISAVAYAEAIRSAFLKPNHGLLIAKAKAVREIPPDRIFVFDQEAAEILCELSPRRTGGQHSRDLMIAAVAMAKNAPLATNDRRLAALAGSVVTGYDPLEIIYVE